MDASATTEVLGRVWEVSKVGNYKEVLGLDEEIRAFSSSLPLSLKIDGYSEFLPQVISETNEKPYLVLAKTYLGLNTAIALLNLHKPFQAKSYSDRQYSRSLEASLSASSWLLRMLNAEVLGAKLDGPASQCSHLLFLRFYGSVPLFPATSVLLVHLAQETITGNEAMEVSTLILVLKKTVEGAEIEI